MLRCLTFSLMELWIMVMEHGTNDHGTVDYGRMCKHPITNKAHFQNDHKTCPKPNFHLHYRRQQAKQQATPSKKRRSSGIGLGYPFIQHLYVRPAFHNF